MVFTCFEAANPLHKPTLQKPRANNTYPKDIGSFWDDSAVPLLLHHYAVASADHAAYNA